LLRQLPPLLRDWDWLKRSPPNRHQAVESAEPLAKEMGAAVLSTWQTLIQQPDVDLVAIASANPNHGEAVEAALKAGKHVVVEYPLALDLAQARRLLALADNQNKLLHVEHIELLGGLHQTVKAQLVEVGHPIYVRYATISPQHPAPNKWTYNPDLFGFPLMGALSRINRLTNLFGSVKTVACQNRSYSDRADGTYDTHLCSAQLAFHAGTIADVVYGKGDRLWKSTRTLEIQGSQGTLYFEGDRGTLINAEGERSIEVASRRGLFVRDTTLVLDHLEQGVPLYIQPKESCYALAVADAARQAAETGQVVAVAEP
ncbi:MAG: Gfo/Idh/MocA family oxidoreductase, partial [Cyanobacteria bacterium P01_D01_bin.128]